MKKKYEKPNMDLEMFEANEYIAACYTVKCINKDGWIKVNGWPTHMSEHDSCKDYPLSVSGVKNSNATDNKRPGYYWETSNGKKTIKHFGWVNENTVDPNRPNHS